MDENAARAGGASLADLAKAGYIAAALRTAPGAMNRLK